jgi:2,5-diketo-D-gluconate reductase A
VAGQGRPAPLLRNHPVQEACRRHGIALEAHSPLGHNREPLTDDTIGGIAEAYGKSPAQVILRWHTQHGRIAIPKSTRPDGMT